MLYMLGQRELARTLFPVGELTKAEVRAHAARARAPHRGQAREHGRLLHHAGRPRRSSSTERMRRCAPGDVVDTAGAVVGTHDGVASFTIGQRRGVGVAIGERRYVVDVDARAATRHARVTRRPAARLACALRDLTFVDDDARWPHDLHVQVRAHGEPVVAYLDGNAVCFAQPQPRVAPGQVVALYDGDALLGGGIAA